MAESAEFQSALDTLQTALTDSLKAFAEWYAREWPFKETEEEWRRTCGEPYPGDEWVKAYNAGVASVLGALDCFLEDHGY
jgi:hypothetical protein